ncbi:FAD:protein FMN transferase [Deinococcus rubellus]|uniref:FAD:protein FMN transferase n=1 Tax=Deinococcus rubellus TaxID=1889240 RepID=UPI0031EABF4F
MFRFSALGTDIAVSGEGQDAAAQEMMRLEALLTRFRLSALTALNRHGELHRPPPELVQAVRHALNVSALTGGLVTPAVLPALEAAGYARRLGDHRGHATSVPDTSAVVCGPELIRLPSGMRLDLGGTAKSWIAERAAEHLLGDGFIDAGGDVVLRQSGVFAVEISRPAGGAPLYLECPPGTWGVATSSTLKRAWAGGHHLIDPRTARPLVSALVQVTAIAPKLTDAEVLTKLAFLDAEKLDALQGPAQVYAFDHEGQFLTRQAGRWQAADASC